MLDQKNITQIDQYLIDFVKALRISKHLTQEDIGNIMGVSRSFIRDVEGSKNRAKLNINHINALADYFGISPREFLPEKAFPVDYSEKDNKIEKNLKKQKTKKPNLNR